MQVLARLVHAEPGARVVEVTAQREGLTLGSALGEAASAEEAEERALQRLRRRLGIDNADGAPQARTLSQRPPARQPTPGPVATPAAPAPAAEEPAPAEPAPEEPAPDPEDWSGELAQIDLQLQRIGWGREQEGTYLERAFGHPSRARITTFSDLMAYLQVLQGLAGGSDPAQAPVPLRRPELLSQCDQLLAQLGWNAGQGRRFLERHFGLASRQQLSDSQLLQFNMVLEEALINSATVDLPSAGAGG
ncbi:MAG: hypothetical protein AB1Z22_09490 [Synechococcaceae cyanobacterium]